MSGEHKKPVELPTEDPVTATMYRLHSWEPKVEAFHVIRQSACYVTYIGDWCGKATEVRERKEGQWFESWEAAHIALVIKSRGAVEQAEEVLQRKRTILGMVQNMRKPT